MSFYCCRSQQYLHPECLEGYKNDIPQPDSNYTYCVQLSHVNKNVTARIVGYFYTGKIEFTASEFKDLLFAANALRIHRLKEQLLVSCNTEQINTYENVSEMFIDV